MQSKITEKYRMWRRENKDKLNAQSRARYAKNKDQLKAKAAIRREKNREKLRQASRDFRSRHPGCAAAYYRSNPEKRLLDTAKKRSLINGLDFNLTIDDIVIPKICPVLGIEISIGGGVGMRDSSPSVDRINNNLGYIKGNICVISFRANRLKSDSTLSELMAIVSYVQQYSKS